MIDGPALPNGPLIAWYGDDFTGSAAVLEVLTFAGFPSVLFFEIPTERQLAVFSNHRGIGLAGFARTKGVNWMDDNLPSIYKFLERVGAPIKHYKVCSTLDSSPTIGSIGRAADLAMAEDDWAPVVIGAPEIGRYQAFGNLFASAGENHYRLDRHPAMIAHPATPMDEADVGLHLEQQTNRQSGLVNLLDLKSGNAQAKLSSEIAAGKSLISFDIVDRQTLICAGQTIWQSTVNPFFVIGSQGVEYALVAAWQEAGIAPEPIATTAIPAVGQIAIVSGSCSPVTAEQIACAKNSGFRAVPLDATCAVTTALWESECARVIQASLEILGTGKSPLIYTACGPDDPSIVALYAAIDDSSRQTGDVNQSIGVGLGRILDALITKTRLSRVVIAGGDSASFGAQQLRLYAVTAKYALDPGATLLSGHSNDPTRDGLEIALKGGQMGGVNFFADLRDGRS